jgi:hypothetical protein
MEKALLYRFCHTPATWIQNFPHAWIQPHYGAHQQLTPRPDNTDNTDKLNTSAITRVQEHIIGFLFYGRSIDCTMLVALGTLASQQSNSIKATVKAMTQRINYAAARPDTMIRYIASDMYLHIHSDASVSFRSASTQPRQRRLLPHRCCDKGEPRFTTKESRTRGEISPVPPFKDTAGWLA